MCRLGHRIFFFTLLLLLPVFVHADDANFRHVFVFGDSLSDTGNLATVVGPFPDPPFYMNRVTNGPVALETLAQGLDTVVAPSMHLVGPASGSNYAVVGARARGVDVIDLGFQTEMFLANHAGVAPADSLYILFIGGNDIRDARDTADFSSAEQVVNSAALAVIQNATRLAMAGARDFLLVTAPDIGLIPETHLLAAQTGDPALARRASRLTRIFNRQLRRGADLLEDEEGIDADVRVFRLDKIFRQIILHGPQLGFTNTSDPCFFVSTMTPNPECDFDSFVFFDEIHPTARVHFLVGTAMLRAVRETDEDESEQHRRDGKRTAYLH